MNRRPRKAALGIQLLLEEYTAEELAEALGLVGGQKGEDLVTYLARTIPPPSQRRPAPSRNGRSGFSAKGETRALQELKNSDPDKYRMLSEFECRIREGTILPTLDDFREFRTVLGKGYKPAKSRKLALGQLMALLAQMDLAAIQAAIAKAPTGQARSEDAYGRLADHIISGSQPRLPGR